MSSLGAQRVGFLDDPSVLPCVGNNAYRPDPDGDLALPLEGDLPSVPSFTYFVLFCFTSWADLMENQILIENLYMFSILSA